MKTTIKKPRLAASQELTRDERILLDSFRRITDAADVEFICKLINKIASRQINVSACEMPPRLRLIQGGKQ